MCENFFTHIRTAFTPQKLIYNRAQALSKFHKVKKPRTRKMCYQIMDFEINDHCVNSAFLLIICVIAIVIGVICILLKEQQNIIKQVICAFICVCAILLNENIKSKYRSESECLERISTKSASTHIMKEFGMLSIETMTLFTDIVNKSFNIMLLISPVFYQKPYIYSFFPINYRNDIQLMFRKTSEIKDPSNNITIYGHYFCTHFIWQENIINLYDSQYHLYNEKEKNDIENLIKPIFDVKYGETTTRWKKPKSTQNDCYSCGLYSIEYIVMLIYGIDPEKYELNLIETEADQTMSLRQHIEYMIRTETITPPPLKNTVDTLIQLMATLKIC